MEFGGGLLWRPVGLAYDLMEMKETVEKKAFIMDICWSGVGCQ